MKALATVLVSSALLAGCANGLFSHDRDRGAQASSSASAPDMPTRAADGRLIGPNGNTLYVYARDSQGASHCNDQCATNWPPLTVAPHARPMGDYTIVTRADGTRQWAYKGQPLYYFARDARAGDTSGEGVGGSWKTVRP